MKNKFILWALLSVTIVGCTGLILYRLNYHEISFVFRLEPMEVRIVDSNKKTINTLKTSTRLTLVNGSYELYPNGKNIDSSPIKFQVDGKSATIVIDPPASEEALSSILDEERNDIESAIFSEFPQNIAKFKIGRGELLKKGEWFVSSLTYKDSTNDNPRDVYKIILNKINNEWNVVNIPQIIPTKYNFPGVPQEIIDSAYYHTSSE